VVASGAYIKFLIEWCVYIYMESHEETGLSQRVCLLYFLLSYLKTPQETLY
jgi:hypothetical protein